MYLNACLLFTVTRDGRGLMSSRKALSTLVKLWRIRQILVCVLSAAFRAAESKAFSNSFINCLPGSIITQICLSLTLNRSADEWPVVHLNKCHDNISLLCFTAEGVNEKRHECVTVFSIIYL